MSRRLSSRVAASNLVDQPPMGPPPDRDRDYRDPGLSSHSHSHAQPISFKHSGPPSHPLPGPAPTAHHHLGPQPTQSMPISLQNGGSSVPGPGSAPNTTHEHREPLTQAEVQEKYSRLKKRYFENEKKHNELLKDFNEAGKRNSALRTERNVLLDRIIELEEFLHFYQDHMKKYEPDLTPPNPLHDISSAFPTSLISKKRRAAFQKNLKQAMHEYDLEMEDPLHPASVEPRLTSRHVGPNATTNSGQKYLNGEGYYAEIHEQNSNIPITRSSSRFKTTITPNPPTLNVENIDNSADLGMHISESTNIVDAAFERGPPAKRRVGDERFVGDDGPGGRNSGEREPKRPRRPVTGAPTTRHSSGTSTVNGSGTPGGRNGNIPDEYQAQQEPHEYRYRDQRESEEYAQEWPNESLHIQQQTMPTASKHRSANFRPEPREDPDNSHSNHQVPSVHSSPQTSHRPYPHASQTHGHSHSQTPLSHTYGRSGALRHSQSQSPLSPPGPSQEYNSQRGSSSMVVVRRDERVAIDRDHAPSDEMSSPTVSVSSHNTMLPPGPTSAGSSSGSTTAYYESPRHSRIGDVSTPVSSSSSRTIAPRSSHYQHHEVPNSSNSVPNLSPKTEPKTDNSIVSSRGVPLLSELQRMTKPKRLKAHTVTSKNYSIPTVPRNNTGRPILPLNVGIMTVFKLGEVCMREHYHTERYIFPIGYEVTRRYLSTMDPNLECVYHCTILDGGDSPKFQIVASDMPDTPIVAGSATGAWAGIVRMANLIRKRQHSNSVSGPDYFGLGQNTIKHLIQELPGANHLKNYVWQNFVEGGPLGGRHAAVIPALPEEHETSYHSSQASALPQKSPSTPQSPRDPYPTRSFQSSREPSHVSSSRINPSPTRPVSDYSLRQSRYERREASREMRNERERERPIAVHHSGSGLSVMRSPAHPDVDASINRDREDVEMTDVNGVNGHGREGSDWEYSSEEEHEDEREMNGRSSGRKENYQRGHGRYESVGENFRMNGVASIGERIAA